LFLCLSSFLWVKKTEKNKTKQNQKEKLNLSV